MLVLNGPGGAPEDITTAALALGGGVPRAVQSDAEIIKSDPVLREAVRKAGPASLFPSLHLRRAFGVLPPPSPETQMDLAVEKFRKNLKVDTEPGSNLIQVSYTNADRRLSVRALQGLVDAFAEHRQRIYSGTVPEIQEREVKRYAAMLDDVDNRIKNAQTQFGVLNIAQDVDLVGARQDNIVQRISVARERARALDAELATARRRLQASPNQVFDSRETTNGTPNDDARNLLTRLRQERAHLAEQYQPTWQGLKEIDAKIALAERQIQENAADRFYTDKKVRNPDLDSLNGKISDLTIERASIGKQLEELARQQGEVGGRADTVRQATEELGQLIRRRETLEGVYRQLSLQQAASKLRNDTVESRAASLRIVQPPTARPNGSSLAVVYIVAGVLLGAVAAVVVGILAALSRQVFITPTEAERALKLPAIVDLDDAQSEFDSPEGRAEVVRLATFLIDGADGEPALNLIEISATNDHHEKVALALALGREFASGWGVPTLIVDLDGEAHDELSRDARGRGKLSFDGVDLVLIQTRIPELWAVTQPPGVESPFMAPRLPLVHAERIINELRRRFRRIVMIAPRDFDSYAARRLYPLADAHLLMVTSEQSRAPVLRALKNTIMESGGDILGFVYTHRRFYIPEIVYRWVLQ